MADTHRFRIDSHKLHLHPQRVADWLAGKTIAPIYIEVSPSGACNHRCRFCAVDFMGYKARFLPTDLFIERLGEMGARGVKSIMYAGEGEPFLHRDMARITLATKAAGIDVAFTTNAVPLKPETTRAILPVTSWIKVSCNAGTPETYARVHGTQARDFDIVMRNMTEAANLREKLHSACTLGFQMVLLPENRHEAVKLARRVRDLGADYLVIKPYSQHPQSHTTEYAQTDVADGAQLAVALAELDTPHFSTIFRYDAMDRATSGARNYARCQALPFWSYIDAGGGVWGCSVFLKDERFAYGNVLETSFNDLWTGPRRAASLAWCDAHLNPATCRTNCRMEPINQYLWELTQPGAHVNFI